MQEVKRHFRGRSCLIDLTKLSSLIPFHRRIALAVSDAALDLDVVLTESYGLVYSARPIRRWLEKKVVTECKYRWK
ncbi:hypothetical protein MKW98_006963 [Papaver atlanticum]|uniref:Uncharacterized protein n=1 Tax=Papaver atlanticum TaxID=357466 RepID=A0AAD4SUX9_9MAGN|nr:hypothetical protein MKW98_006963 [Papaver atlanticum]